MTSILKIDRLCKTYDNGTCALREISFSVEAGEFVVVLGKSGSGKSTLMRCINRLVEPTSGRIFLEGEEVTGAPLLGSKQCPDGSSGRDFIYCLLDELFFGRGCGAFQSGS
jgi:ABC-type phosphate/phosphonate transport system ATPase subunit